MSALYSLDTLAAGSSLEQFLALIHCLFFYAGFQTDHLNLLRRARARRLSHTPVLLRLRPFVSLLKLWTAFEKPSNAGPGWQSSLQLDVQDDGIEIPYARRQSWPDFVRWLTSKFNIRSLFEIQHEKFKQLAQDPGERVHAYNIRWNLERELVDELAGAELYPTGTVHEEELENMYVRSLLGPFSSKLTDLRAIRGTLIQVVGGTRDTASEGCVSIGLSLLQKHTVGE